VREINRVPFLQQDAAQQKRQSLLVFHHKNVHQSIPFFYLGVHQSR